jgi:hypothetical protein
MLLDIMGDPNFKPEDVSDTKWMDINNVLAANEFDHDAKYELQDKDAGWKKTPIYIDVLFHHRMKHPGTQWCFVFDLYHHSIVSIVKEKLGNAADDTHFHYEP